jgi:hypothetical protein
MDDRDKLQREVIAGLDALEQLVQEEQNLSQAVPTTEQNTHDREEASNLKKQMEELHKRFINLRGRIEAWEDIKNQPSPAEVSSTSEPLQRVQSTGVPADRRVEGQAPSLLKKKIWSSQLLKQVHPSRVAALIVLLVGWLAAWLLGLLYSGGQVAIESEPAEADVYMDDQFRGQTPVQLESIQGGRHRVRLTKEGYEPLVQELRLSPGQTARVDIRLNELSAAQLQELARSLFDQGKLREADRICTLLYEKPSYEAFVLDLRGKILTALGRASCQKNSSTGPPGTIRQPAASAKSISPE